MKRILSIILVIAMLTSMSISAFADAYPEFDDALTLTEGFDITSSTTPYAISGASAKKVVTGVYGKEANDESVLITEGENQKYFYISHKHGESIYLDGGKELEGYLVVDFNFKLTDNDIKFVQAAVSGRQHPLSHAISTSSPGYNHIGWNNVRAVYDPTGHADIAQYNGKKKGDEGAAPKGTVYGSVTTYLNGVEQGTRVLKSDDEGWFSFGFDSILVQVVSGNEEAVHNTYIDDIKIYKSDWNEAPIIPYIEDGDTFTVEEDTILLSDTTSVNSVISAIEDKSSAIVYTNSTLSTRHTGTNLSKGNVIVARGIDDEVYKYFTVDIKDDNTYLVNASKGTIEGMGSQKFTVSSVAGLGGKSTEDKSVMLKSYTLTESSSYDGNGYLTFDYTKNSDYLVAEFNYYPVEDRARKMMIVTNRNAGVTGEYKADAGKWNKVMFYIDFTGEKPLAHLFLNGVRMTAETGSETKFDGATNKQLRIGYYGDDTDAKEYFTAYIDDIKIYESVAAPSADRSTPALIASSEKVSVSGNVVTVKSGTTAADLVAANSEDIVRVYKNSTCTAAASTLFDGAVAVVESSSNASLNYYEIAIEKDSSVIYQVNDFTAFTKSPARANKSEIIGVAGKAADDSSIVLQQTRKLDNGIYNMYLDIPWGTSTSLDSWDKSDFVGYLVYEFNVLNKSINSIRLATDQNSPVSCDIVPSVLADNQWNKVSIVLDYSGSANTGKSTVYVNGKPVGTSVSTSALGAEYKSANRRKNTLRLLFTGPNGTKDANGEYMEAPADCGTVYVDDIAIYEATGMPDISVPVLDGKYLDEDGRFIVGNDVKVSEIQTENAVRVYTDDKFTQLADNNAVVADGNVVVLEDAKGTLSYFIAEVWDGTTVISNKLPTNIARGKVETVPGFAGKDASDTVTKITRTSVEDSNSFLYENWSGTKLNENSKYIAFEANVLPNDNDYNYGFHFATAQHSLVSERINMADNNFMPGRWNKIVAVMDIETRNVHTYVNGKLIDTELVTGFSNGTNLAIRIVLYMPNGDCMYIDDYKIYESINYPEVYEAPERFEGVSADYVVSNDLVYTTASKKVADIKSLYTLDANETIDVYSVDFGSKLADSANIVDGAVVVVTGPNNNYYSNLVNVIDSIPVPEVGKIKILGDGNGEFTIVTKANEGTLLCVRNILAKGDVSEKYLDFVEDDVVMSFHPIIGHGTIKMFAIEDFASLKPLDKVVTLECTLGEAPAEE